MKRRCKVALLWLAKCLGVFWLTRALTRGGFVVVGWHGVSLADEHLRLPKYFISRQTLRRRIAYLHKRFRITSLDSVVGQRERRRLVPSQVVLTFDDGMYNFAGGAVPILREFEAPATLFVVSSYLSGENLGFRLMIRDLFQQTPLDTLPALEWMDGQGGSLRENMEKHVEAAVRACAALPPEAGAREIFLRRLAHALRVDIEPLIQNRIWDHLSADEIRELANEGFDMQVHSHLHIPVTEQPESVYNDTRMSRALIESASGRKATDYCYPSGLWSRSSWEALEESGMRTAVTTKLGPNFALTPAMALRRYVDDETISQLEFEAMVSGVPWLVHLLFHPRRLFEPSEASSTSTPLY